MKKSLEKRNISHQFVTILGIKVSSSPRLTLLDFVLSLHTLGRKYFIVTPNPEIILNAQSDKKQLIALNTADISLPDGVGLLFAAKLLHLPLKHTIPGRRFMLDLISEFERKNLKVCFLGSTPAVMEDSLHAIKMKYPKLSIQGFSGPLLTKEGMPLDTAQKIVEKETLLKINQFKPDILFIGFGAPKQELWFSKNRDDLNIGGAMVVGGSFDVLSGRLKKPPRILEQLGLEWSWRLIQEPSRFLRIIRSVVIFPIRVFLYRLFAR